MVKVDLRPVQEAPAATIGARIWIRTRRALAHARRWMNRHEQRPEPFDGGRGGRLALVFLVAVALVYTIVLTRYLFALHNTFATTAEDLGIMDQVLWNTSHGHFMSQTICNPIGDTNCLGVASRFAIHFEPILIPLSLLYRVAPNVRWLLFLQVAVTASGVFPAYLLAARRLRHALWGVAFSLLFLLYPALQAAVIDAFHPETLAATLLMWALYCLSVRRYRMLVVLCCVALLCKETLALDVIGIGLFVALAQRRRWQGVSLCLLGVAALVLALVLMHVASPLGRSPVAGRLDGLTHDPLHTLALVATDPDRRAYMFRLLAPAGFLPLLSPWTLLIALPSMLLNLASSDPLMYSGGYQYNSDIVPVLIAATIDAVVWLRPACTRLAMRGWRAWRSTRAHHDLAAPKWAKAAMWSSVILASVALPVTGLSTQAYVAEAYQAVTHKDSWPVVTAHDRIGGDILRLIPASASISAQAALVPHVSERLHVYQFPVEENDADYVFLDVSVGAFYPFATADDYVDAVEVLLDSCRHRLVAAQDGYLLLQRSPSLTQSGTVCHMSLPQSFYSFAYVAPSNAATLATPASFAGTLELVGYERTPAVVTREEPWMAVTTYWRVLQPVTSPLTIAYLVTLPGGMALDVTDSVTQEWLPPSAWTPGAVVRVQTWPLYMGPLQRGTITVSAQVRSGAPETLPPQDTAIAAMPARTASGGYTARMPRFSEGGTAVLLAAIAVR